MVQVHIARTVIEKAKMSRSLKPRDLFALVLAMRGEEHATEISMKEFREVFKLLSLNVRRSPGTTLCRGPYCISSAQRPLTAS